MKSKEAQAAYEATKDPKKMAEEARLAKERRKAGYKSPESFAPESFQTPKVVRGTPVEPSPEVPVILGRKLEEDAAALKAAREEIDAFGSDTGLSDTTRMPRRPESTPRIDPATLQSLPGESTVRVVPKNSETEDRERPHA